MANQETMGTINKMSLDSGHRNHLLMAKLRLLSFAEKETDSETMSFD